MNFLQSYRMYLVVISGILLMFIAVLLAMGRTPICECGYVKLWHGIVYSAENSQHIFDWYTFSHIIHGFGFYWLFTLLRKRLPWLPTRMGFLLALFLEIGWEILENTDFIINRYRETTISLDYYGDSMINSLFDVVAMAVGFLMAARLPIWFIVCLTIVLEVFVGLSIRDNLTLNIIMLLHPFVIIRTWQSSIASG